MTQSYVLMLLNFRVWIKSQMNERLQSENFSAGDGTNLQRLK
jgi:hypothetical protein